jgi:hypothetical protein
VLWSHLEHPLTSSPEDEGARSTGREDYQHGSGGQTNEQRERKNSADWGMKSTADSGKKGEKPSTPEEWPAYAKSDGTDATPDTDTEDRLKTAFFSQMEVVERMLDVERELGIITPAGYKQMNALTRLAGAIAREELKRRKRNRDGSLGVRKTRTDAVGSFISQS